ncbi:MAG: Minf_1886 family protein [Candidatus Omnitrophota bacterium]
MNTDFLTKVEEIIHRDSRYKPDAYEFIMQALLVTQKKLKRSGHVSGRELLEGIRELALEQYGPLARTVLEHWGIKRTQDFGELVFNMIEEGLLGKTEEDSRNDFKDIYDFSQAFDLFGAKEVKSL